MHARASWELIQALHHGGPCSLVQLAQHARVDERQARAALDQLIQKGFVITGTDTDGYVLERVPDLMLEEAVLPHVQADGMGLGGWVHLPTTDSTNSHAASLAFQGAAHGTVVVAEGQSAGRGRRGRSFVSPPTKGIYLSVVLRPPFPPSQSFRLTFCGAHAVADAAEATGLKPRLKWPNDVLVNGRKLCGILSEMNATPDRVDHVILGIGVNINSQDEDFPPEVATIATSVRRELGAPADRVLFCARMLSALGTWYRLALEDFPAVLQRTRERSDTLGRTVRVSDGEKELVGEALDLDEEGALLLKTGRTEVRVVVGDVLPV